MKCPDDRIRIINTETGEVRETDAGMKGVRALTEVLIRDIESYREYDYLKDRDIKNDIQFEGHPHFRKVLEDRFKKLLN